MEASGTSLAETKNEFEKYRTKTEIDGIYYNNFNVRYFRNLLETAVSEQKNIDKLITKETGLPVIIAEDPLSCVAIGTGKALDQEETFSTMLVN